MKPIMRVSVFVSAALALLSTSLVGSIGPAAAATPVAIASITPAERLPGVTATVVIQGSGFQPGAKLAFTTLYGSYQPSVVNSVQVDSPAQITANITTSTDIGHYEQVTVTNPDGGQASKSFTVYDAPKNAASVPNHLSRGTTTDVRVTCENCFTGASATVSGPGVTVTKFDGARNVVTVQIDPAAPVGDRTLTLVLVDGGSVSTTVSVTAGPPVTVSSITPNFLATNITTSVVVRGSGFQPGAQLTFKVASVPYGGVTTKTVQVDSPTQITATITTENAILQPLLLHVIVTNPDGGQGVLFEGLAINVQPISIGTLPAALPQGITASVEVYCIRCSSIGVSASISGTGVEILQLRGYRLTVRVAPDAPPGDRRITINLADRGQLGGNFTVLQAPLSPSLSSQASPGPLLGGPIRDTVHATGGWNPSGTVTFRLYGPDDASCARPPVFTTAAQATPDPGFNYDPGFTTTSPAFTPTTVGTYRWVVDYSGDVYNRGASSPCNAPNASVVVRPFAPPPCTRTLSGDVNGNAYGNFFVEQGENVCLTNARVKARIYVNTGGALTVSGSQVTGGIVASRPSFFSLCDSLVSTSSDNADRAVSVDGAAVPVRVGDPANGCGGNRVAGSVVLSGSTSGLVAASNLVSRAMTVDYNTVGVTVLKANTVLGALGCTGNDPAPTNAGQLNSAKGGKTGQCAAL